MNRKYGLLAGAALATAVAVSASVTPTVHADYRWDSRHSWDYDFDDWGYDYNYWNRYNYRQPDSGRYFYWNGSYYYRMSDGSYYIYRDGEWKPLTNNRDNSSSTNNLVNDNHYRYENGYHYYVLENGDYYYYQNGRWVFVKKSADNQKESELENPGGVELPENPPFNGADGEFNPFESGTIEFPETPLSFQRLRLTEVRTVNMLLLTWEQSNFQKIPYSMELMVSWILFRQNQTSQMKNQNQIIQSIPLSQRLQVW